MDKQLQNALDFIDQNKEEMLSLWEELVNIESGPDNKEGVDAIGLKISEILNKEGFATRFIDFENAGNTLIGELDMHRPDKSIAFLGHMDTVFTKGTIKERPFKIEDGKAYGPGVLDMKAGLVTTIFAIKALNSVKYDKRPVKVVFSGDEEVAHSRSGSSTVLIEELKGCVAALNSETGSLDNSVVVGRKGGAIFNLEVEGVAAHTGIVPEKGRNAILEISHKIIEIQKLTDFEKGVIYNVGSIEGGANANTVPDYAKIVIGVRYKKVEQMAEVEKKIEEIAAKTYVEGTKTKLSFKGKMSPMEHTDANDKLFKTIKAGAAQIGLDELHSINSGGASDAACSVIAGVPSICALGPKGEWNHTPREYAVVESLFERAKLLIATVINID